VVALEEDVAGGRTYAEAEVRDIRGDWAQYPFVLRPDRADSHARLAILFPGKGRVWVDQVSLLPGDCRRRSPGRRRGTRGRAASRLPALARRQRGPGLSLEVGRRPRDRRPLWTNLAWKNEREPGDIGTDEFVAFCRRVGAEPSITVNVEGRGRRRRRPRPGSSTATGRDLALRAHARRQRPSRALSREVLGDRQRDLGRLGARPLRRRHLRAQCPPLRAGHARGGPAIELIATGDNDMAGTAPCSGPRAP
jgi:hypothetical protein